MSGAAPCGRRLPYRIIARVTAPQITALSGPLSGACSLGGVQPAAQNV